MLMIRCEGDQFPTAEVVRKYLLERHRSRARVLTVMRLRLVMT